MSAGEKRNVWLAVVLGIASLMSGAAAQQKTQSVPVRIPPPRSDADFARVGETSATRIRYQDYDSTPLTFSSSAQYVLVPAVVLGKDGHPLRGLKKDDFRLFENGKEQKIASVEELTAIAAPIPIAKRSSGEFTNVGPQADTTPRRLIVIAFDALNTPFADRERAKRQLLTFLADNVDASNLYELAIIDFNGLHVIHDFTEDTPALMAALQRIKMKLTALDRLDRAALTQPPALATAGGLLPSASVSNSMNLAGSTDSGASKDTVAYSHDEAMLAAISFAETSVAQSVQADAAAATLKAFQQLAQQLQGVPGRKSLIWISGGFPFSLDPNTAAVSEAVSFPAYQHTMQLLSNALIALYPVDARGLLTLYGEPSITIRKDQARGNAMLGDESARQLDVLSTMRAFAEMTGGHAYINNNDTKTLISDASRDGESYYMLSYAVDKSNKRPGWRKISVKAGDMPVRARTGYYLTQATLDPQGSAKLDIDTAIGSPLEYTGIPVKLVVEPPSSAAGKRKVSFAMQVPPNIATVDAANNNHMFVEIAYAFRNEAGADAGHKRVSYNLNLNAAQLQAISSSGVGYNDSLELAPGTYDVRLVVRDNLNGRMGSVGTKLELK